MKYRGKHEQPNIFRPGKAVVLLASLLLLLTVAVGGTVAYLMTSTPSVENTFDPASVTVTVEEVFNDNSKSDIKLKNTSDIPAYVRAAVVTYWKKGNDIVPQPTGGRVTMPTILGENWFQKGELYYYAKRLPVGGVTDSPLFTTAITATVPEGYTFHVDILAEAIQGEPIAAVTQAWEVNLTSLGGDIS